MARITRNRYLPMWFAKWMSFSYQNCTSSCWSASSCWFDEDESESEQEIEDENETTSKSSEAECKDESECKDGWEGKDKLECEEEWVVFQEESESDISEKEMEREEERNSKEKVEASGPYFICLRLGQLLDSILQNKVSVFISIFKIS
jgi:glucan-binding YG repeat protein